MGDEMWVQLILLSHLLGLLTAFKAVMEARTSQGAIAWIIFLVTVPEVALPAYWVFGRSRFYGYRLAKRMTDRTVRQGMARLVARMSGYREERRTIYHGTIAGKLAPLPSTDFNDVQLLIDGKATFRSMFDGIEAASSYVLVQFYIVRDDEVGRALQRRLIAKAAEGVKVAFLYDEIGSYELSTRYLDTLKEAGIAIHPFNTRKGWKNKFQLNFRNHRKVVVVDGRYAWLGGLNVGDEYLGKDPKIGDWRDTHVRLEGPSVMAAQLSFAEDWYWACGEQLDYLDWTPHPCEKGAAKVLVIPSGPADEKETAELMFLHAINRAKRRIWIASPYFVPDDAVVYALQLAGLRGVDVRILIPEKTDHLVVWLAAFSYFEEIGLTGVRFYRYRKGFLHEKVMLIDERTASVGTANFDNRSFRLNFEITAVVEEAGFVAAVEKMFERDFEHAYLQASDILERKPFWFKVAVRLARLMAPIL